MSFYRDLGDPLIQRLAKAIVRRRGGDPDLLVAETGYADAQMIPAWWKVQTEAMGALAVVTELGLIKEMS